MFCFPEHWLAKSQVRADNLRVVGEPVAEPAWHSDHAISRRINDLERKHRNETWNPAWGSQPVGLTAARMAAFLDLFEEEEECESTPCWAFPSTDPRSWVPAVEQD